MTVIRIPINTYYLSLIYKVEIHKIESIYGKMSEREAVGKVQSLELVKECDMRCVGGQRRKGSELFSEPEVGVGGRKEKSV